ncbi:MAG TPA: hypothetical protein VGR74_12550, partial [Actinomycetota bacterium]|nr:hypothetical protein [Actinomycetota bacterium]
MPAHPGPQPSPGRIGDHAVVLGASMAGLLAARVLADAYAQVTVIDRDQLPQAGSHRRGVPQGRHLHALLAERFRLAPDQIREAMLTAHNRAGWRLAADRHDPGPDPAPPAPTLAELFAESRGQT